MTGSGGFGPVHTPPPEASRPAWPWALLAVVLVIVAGVAIWALAGGGLPGTTPSPTPAAVVSPPPPSSPPPAVTPPTAAPTDAPPVSPGLSPPPTTPGSPTARPGSPTARPGSPGAEVRAQIDAIVAQVPELRQLEPLREVPYEFVTREEFQVDLQDLIDEETDPEELATEERTLKRLGLLAPEVDLREAILELYGSQVAAFYRPDTGSFYIIGEPQTLTSFDQMVVAHEFTHALQDHHFDLEGTRISDPSEGDAALAQTAAIEGDASLLMILWGQANLTPQELMSIGNDINPADLDLLERMPPILRRQLEFPYNDGLLFSLAVFAEGFSWAGIDETLGTPPASTEQILHPEKYFAGEAPVIVDLPDLSSALGVGWQRNYTQTMGELNIQVWVGGGEEPIDAIPGLPPEQPHADAAAGWGGDRLVMYEHADDGWAIAWEIAWDTAADADDFLVRARELQDTLDGQAEIAQVEPQTVRITLAHDETTLAALAAAFGE
ncbi:hypothetical protein BH24CHL6_BH24CHL6_11060 [soil metagenome]